MINNKYNIKSSNETVVRCPDYNINMDRNLQIHTWMLCKKYNIEYELVIAMLQQESHLNVFAVNYNSNGSADSGIAQHNSRFQDYHCGIVGMDKFNAFDPEKGVELCVRLSAHYRDIWVNDGQSAEDIPYMILGCYNKGLEPYKAYVKKYKKVGTPYSVKIMSIRDYLKTNKELPKE
jgi:hypothetical protein